MSTRGKEDATTYLGHLLTVGLRVEGGLGKEDGVFLGGNTQLVVEGVVPDLLHVIPVGDDAVLDRVLDGQDTTLGLGFITDVRVLLAHTHHDALIWSQNFDEHNFSHTHTHKTVSQLTW